MVMKVGDLVMVKDPTTSGIAGVFLVTARDFSWIRVLGMDSWQRASDFEVINESR